MYPSRTKLFIVILLMVASVGTVVSAGDKSSNEELHVVLLADEKDHGPAGNGLHDYPLWQKRWSVLLSGKSDTKVSTAWHWPTKEHFQTVDVIVAYCYIDWTEERLTQVRNYLENGGGLVLIHSASWTKPKPSDDVAKLVGVGGFQLWRHGDVQLDMTCSDHPICEGVPELVLLEEDEAYWPPTPIMDGVTVLATSVEDKGTKGSTPTAAQPMFWTYELGKGRVFGCVPGHSAHTFDNPIVRKLLLRGIAWAASEDTSRFAEKAYLDNGRVRLGIDLEHGGTICFLTTGSDLEKDNLVNIHDLGRYIQQSYYAGKPIDRQSEGQHRNFSPWTWNPIQAGGIGCVSNPPHPNASSEILDFKESKNSMYIKCVPRLWDMPGEAAECVFEQWMWLEEDTVRVRNKVMIERTDNIWKEGVVRDQELPAVYPIARLRDCYTYIGDAPWTGDILVKMPDHPKGYQKGLPPTHPDGFPWNRFKPTEPWAACVNPETGIGFGVYSPRADATWLCGWVDHLKRDNNGDGSLANSTSYIAPLTKIALNKDSVFEYEYYLILGSVEDIRGFVYKKEGKTLDRDQR